MKRQFKFILASFVLVLGFAFTFVNLNETQSTKTSLLWEISGNGLKKPSYLFGTMHLIQKDYFYFPSTLEKIIKKSEVVLTEISLDKLGDQQEALKHIYLKEGKLTDFFTTEQKDTLYAWAKSKLKMEKEAFDASFGKMKPFVIVQTVIQMNFFGKTESYEMKIKEVAEKSKIPFLGFESVAEQVAFFDNLSPEKQAGMVMENIRDEAKNVAIMIKMQGMYKRQQVDSLYFMVKNDGGTISNDEAIFLVNRNKAWIPTIESTIKDKKTFIAVGAGHLSGENGVIELLRKAGYTVNPIQF